MLSGWMGGAAEWEDDQAVLAFFESQGAVIDAMLGEVRKDSVKKTVSALLDSLPAGDKAELLKAL